MTNPPVKMFGHQAIVDNNGDYINASNPLPTTATISGDINVDSTSVSTSGIMGKASGTNADFTTAYASGTTITCSSLPSGVTAIKADDIVSIVQIATSGAVTNTYSRDDVTITASGTDPTTLTVTGATFAASDTFVVYTNIPQSRGDKVDLIEVAGTATNVNGGNRDAGTQTITLADDDPAVTALELIDDSIYTDGSGTPSKGILVMGTDGTNPQALSVNSDGELKVNLETADIEIGAVELKNATDDTRAVIGVGSSAAVGDNAVYVADANVKSDTAAIKTAIEIVDDWDNAASDGASVSGDVAHDTADAGEPVKIGGIARSSQETAVSEDDRVNGVFNVYGEQVNAGYDWSTQSNSTTEANPISEQYVEEELIDSTNVAAATNYYPSSAGMTMGGFKDLDIQGVISGGVTFTVEATLDDAASPDWLDITPAGYNMVTNSSGTASFVDTSFILSFDNLNVKRFRIKSITSDATNGVQYHIRRKAL